MNFSIQKQWLENSQNIQQSTAALTFRGCANRRECWEHGGEGTEIEFGVWGEDKEIGW